MDQAANIDRTKIGHLTPEQEKKIADFLTNKWGNGNPNELPTCSMCKDSQMSWGLGSHIVAPLVVQNGAPTFGSVIYPWVTVTCSNCGNTHLVNTIVMGLTDPFPDGKSVEKPAEKEAIDG